MPKLRISLFQCRLSNSHYVLKYVSTAARSFGRVACYQTRVFLFDTFYTERLLRMFITKSGERIIETKTCFFCRYVLILLIRTLFPIFIFKFHYSFNDIHKQQLTSLVNHRKADFFFCIFTQRNMIFGKMINRFLN